MKKTGGSSYVVDGKTHYQLNKEYYIKKAQKAKEKTRQLVRESKNKPCADCGVKYPYYVMDFDHTRGEKAFELSASYLKRGYLKVKEEIAKCDVVCSNCHRERTAIRMGLNNAL